MSTDDTVAATEVHDAPKVHPERITSDAEGSVKQKAAAKKLSDYSREVASRKSQRAPEKDPDPPTEPEAAPSEAPPEPHWQDVPRQEAPEKTSSLSTGNAGVGVAALCLYLSYGRESAVPKVAPKAAPKAGPESPPKAVPKFRKL